MNTEMKITHLQIKEIYCDHEWNCRKKILPIDVIDLIASIDTIGLQQPIIVIPYTDMPGFKWKIVSGHRRYTAMRSSEKKYQTIPCIIREDLNEMQAKVLNLEENLKRKDLNKFQEAKAIEVFLDEGWTHREISEKLSVPLSWVQIRATILDFIPEIQEQIAAGFLTDDQIRQLKRVKSHAAQMESVKKIKVAKEGGESIGKIRITQKKPKNPLRNSRRDSAEIFKFMEQIQEVIGNNFATRCLAWAAGTVNDFEILRDLRDEAEAKGIKWELPQDILKALSY